MNVMMKPPTEATRKAVPTSLIYEQATHSNAIRLQTCKKEKNVCQN